MQNRIGILWLLALLPCMSCQNHVKSLQVKDEDGHISVWFGNKNRLDGLSAAYTGMNESPVQCLEKDKLIRFRWKDGTTSAIRLQVVDNHLLVSSSYDCVRLQDSLGFVGSFFQKIPGWEEGMSLWRINRGIHGLSLCRSVQWAICQTGMSSSFIGATRMGYMQLRCL